VRIYSWDGSSWNKLGGDIDGEAVGECSGDPISLSSDGRTLAIGVPSDNEYGFFAGLVRVYSWDGSSWYKLGSDIYGEAEQDFCGSSVSLSSDGRTLAIGAIGNDGNGSFSGHVRVYSWDGSSWNKLGGDIDGEAAGDFSGSSVSLSSDGRTLAIGATHNNKYGSYTGHVRVYSWGGSSWNKLGGDIDGEAAGDLSGGSVSLSSDGRTLAIGAPGNSGNGDKSGHVRIYSWDGSSWNKLGGDIDGEAAGDKSGSSVSLSSDGRTLAIGAPGNSGNGEKSGHVRIYSWDGSSWNKLRSDIDGEAVGDCSGNSVSLSSDGITLAIGAPGNSGYGDNSGHVRVYNFSIKKRIKNIVEQKINEWQEKGEFEKTSDFLLRVNEKTRDIKINSFQDEAISRLEQECIKSINISDFKLGDYDADNETFLIEHISNSKYIIPVPLNEARYFKENFLKAGIRNIKCYLNENEFILSNFEISIWPSYEYEYNLTNSVEYKISEIDYNFSAIELEDIESSTNNLNLINTNKISVGNSEIDVEIPLNSKIKNKYAIIIGNENYSSYQKTLEKEQDVPYAVNDASIFKEYALKTLGVEEDNLYFLENATSGQMNQTIDLVTMIVSKLGNKAELIFYYAGHGFPDELTKEPYLIPVDVSTSYLNNAISLDDLYDKFSKTGAKRVLAFVDACFSGGARENSLFVSRGVKINPKMTNISNNLVVFSASSESQSALPYEEQGHGMFTYYLLNKLKESSGKIPLGELYDYISEEVSLNSLKINQTEQEPNVIFSPTIENKWRNWQLY
ncbi:MAG: caspase family protein, partial [Proteobacteria bacterium]|nr:caspase family protein [Pseudomonadota bacterium]